MRKFKSILSILIIVFMFSFIGCEEEKKAISKYSVGNKIILDTDKMISDGFISQETSAEIKDKVYTIKKVSEENSNFFYVLKEDSTSFDYPEEYIQPESKKSNVNASNKNDSENDESSKEKSINIFESMDTWNKYVAGKYTGKKVSFEGTVDTDGIHGGVDKGDETFTVYSLSHKVEDGYMMAVVGTITDDTIKKGDKVSGWGIINSSEKGLGAPTIMVVDVKKK